MTDSKAGKALKILYLGFILLFLYLPIGTLMVLSFNQSKSMSVWTGFTTKWYSEMFRNSQIMEAIGNTFSIAVVSAIIATIVGTLACVGIMAMGKRSQNVLLGLNNIPLLNADIVIGISLMMTFLVFRISLSWGTVLLSHVTFGIPYVLLSVLPKFRQLTPNAYEAALDLGATPAYAFRKVVLPDIMPGVISGFMLAFTMSVDDFVITHFTRGAGINTISTLIYSQVKVGIRPTLFALSTIIFVVVLIVLIVANIISGRGNDSREKNKSIHICKYKETEMTKKKVLMLVLVFTLVLGLLSGCSEKKGQNGEVRVYCFGDYVDPDLLGEFENETGIKVIMDTFDTNEEMYPVVSKQSVKYDVICCSDYMIEKLIAEGNLYDFSSSSDFEPLQNLENYGNLEEKYLKIAEGCDPGNKYSVPHTYGTLGVMYNTNNIAEGEITSWTDLWNEKYSQQIVMPDSMRDNFAIALKAKGYSLNTTSENELKEATEYLETQKPLVYTYANDSARDLAIGESADIVVVWNGEVLYSQEENENLEFVIPSEGTEEFMDLWAVPAYAENIENARKWIDYMLKKETAIANFDYLTYSIPNKAVIEMVSEDEKQMSYLFPEEDILNKCETLKSLGGDMDDMYSKYWKEFKAE